MRDYIRRNIAAAYLTDAAGAVHECNILDALGASMLDGFPINMPLESSLYLDPDDAPIGAVSTMAPRGSWGIEMSSVAGPAGSSAFAMTADGLVMGGNILRAAAVSIGPIRKITIMAEVTRSDVPLGSSGSIFSVNSNGSAAVRMGLRYTGTNYQLVGPDNSIITLAPIGGIGDRQVIGGEIDLIGGQMVAIEADGFTQGMAIPSGTIPISRVDIGHSCRGVLHKLTVIAL